MKFHNVADFTTTNPQGIDLMSLSDGSYYSTEDLLLPKKDDSSWPHPSFEGFVSWTKKYHVIEPAYEFIPAEDVNDKKIDIYQSFQKKIYKTGLIITPEQRKTCMAVLNAIVHDFMPEEDEIQVIRTGDDEIQFSKSIALGYISLIIDEFGGLTFLIMQKKGFGYKCDYFHQDELDKKTIHKLAKSFITVQVLEKGNTSSSSVVVQKEERYCRKRFAVQESKGST